MEIMPVSDEIFSVLCLVSFLSSGSFHCAREGITGNSEKGGTNLATECLT
jgi:hypothetical protein